MRNVKNPIIHDKLEAALNGKGRPRAKKKTSKELVERETNLRKQFRYRHPHAEPSTAILEPQFISDITLAAEPGAPEQSEPSAEEITAALYSVTTSSEVPTTIEDVQAAEQQIQPERFTGTIPPMPSSAGPFFQHITSMINRLKDAKNLLSCELEQTTRRLEKSQAVLKAAQRDVDTMEMSVLLLTEKLEKLDQNIAECNTLGSMSLDIASLLPHGPHKSYNRRTEHVGGMRRSRWSDDPDLCREADISEFFKNNPGNWSTSEIVAGLPAHKQVNAKPRIYVQLCGMVNRGKLVRVTTGVYALPKQK